MRVPTMRPKYALLRYVLCMRNDSVQWEPSNTMNGNARGKKKRTRVIDRTKRTRYRGYYF